MTRLRTCDACSRHVFVTETHCPFCAVPLAPLRGTPLFKLDPRSSRAQRFALAGALAGLIGCQDSRTVAIYGASIPPGTGGLELPGTGGAGSGGSTGASGTTGGAGGHEIQILPAYGIAPIDAGHDGTDAGHDGTDAGDEGDTGNSTK